LSVDSAARTAAPGQLRLVQAFLNTIDREAGRDELDTPSRMAAWLASVRLTSPNGEFDEPDRRRQAELRAAMHDLVAASPGGAAARRAVTTLNEEARQARLGIRLHPTDGYRLMSEGLGVDRVIGDLLVPVLGAMAAGTWLRLKVCANEECGKAFYDGSRNRSGRWCSMARCGNRSKGRVYRQRRTAGRHQRREQRIAEAG
jgi:predicted RNA-binding Zn ribbon-like protein